MHNSSISMFDEVSTTKRSQVFVGMAVPAVQLPSTTPSLDSPLSPLRSRSTRSVGNEYTFSHTPARGWHCSCSGQDDPFPDKPMSAFQAAVPRLRIPTTSSSRVSSTKPAFSAAEVPIPAPCAMECHGVPDELNFAVFAAMQRYARRKQRCSQSIHQRPVHWCHHRQFWQHRRCSMARAEAAHLERRRI
jgi:hypothetical protein